MTKLFSLLLMSQAFYFSNARADEALPTLLLSPTYQSIHDNILVPKCMMCHTAGQSAEDVPLEPYSALIAQKEVVAAGNSAQSTLYTLTANGKMPKKGANIGPLSAAEVNTIKTWIDGGANP